MKRICYKEVATQNNPHGVDVRKLFSTEEVVVVHIHLKPSESIKKHSSPVNVFFYVLEGEGIIEIGDEKQAVSRDTLVESPKNIPHCLYNESNADFRVLVVKTPGPTAEQNKEGMQNILNSK